MPLKPEFTKPRRPKKVVVAAVVTFETANYIETQRKRLPNKPKATPGRVVEALADHAKKTNFAI